MELDIDFIFYTRKSKMKKISTKIKTIGKIALANKKNKE